MTIAKEKAVVRDELRRRLYPPQRDLYNRIKENFKAGKPAVVCAGMRAGKTFTYTVLSFDYEHVMVVGQFGRFVDSLSQLRSCTETMREYHKNVIFTVPAQRFFELPVKAVTKGTLIILEDAFWWHEMFHNERKIAADGIPLPTLSEDFFEQVIKLTPHVLAIGSRGPRMFTRHEVWSYATWDLNTSLTRQDFDDAFTKEPEKAQRDFGG